MKSLILPLLATLVLSVNIAGAAPGDCSYQRRVECASQLWSGYCSEKESCSAQRHISHRIIPASCGSRFGGCGSSCGTSCGGRLFAGFGGFSGFGGGGCGIDCPPCGPWDFAQCGSSCGSCRPFQGLLSGLQNSFRGFGHHSTCGSCGGAGCASCGAASHGVIGHGSGCGCSSCGSAHAAPIQHHHSHPNHAPTQANGIPQNAIPQNAIPEESVPMIIDGPVDAPGPSPADPSAPSTLEEPAVPTPVEAEDKSASIYRPWNTVRGF
jgi:hypothetical protein